VPRSSEEILTALPASEANARLAYGPEPKQFADLWLPRGEGPWPLAVVIHGGYWKAIYNLIHAGHMCGALAEAGIASWSVEYRCVGDPGGGWPGTGEDVALALRFLDELEARHPVRRAVLVGHSAGGQLALWAAKAAGLPVLALAAVADVRESARRTGPDGPPARFLGGMPDDVPERYRAASPLELLPLGVRQVLIHGTADETVPYELSQRYVEAAGDETGLVTLEGAGHFELIDPLSAEWPRVLHALRELV
jgi:acetyl esterase/lipase